MAVLEVAAGSYITILGPPETSAFRLTLAQAFNGIASVLGPVIAAQTFLVSALIFASWFQLPRIFEPHPLTRPHLPFHVHSPCL